MAVLVPALVTFFGMAVYGWLMGPSISIAYLLGVLFVATRCGRLAAFAASLLSVLALNYFFTPPLFSLEIDAAEEWIRIGFFLAAAVVASSLAARLRVQVDAMRLAARRITNLYDFNRRISAAVGQDDVLWAVVHHVAATIGGHSLVLMPSDGRLAIMAGYPPEDRIDAASQAAAAWAWEFQRPAGKDSPAMADSDWLFLPMRTGRGPIGVLGVQIGAGAKALTDDLGRLLATLADQAAIAVERTALVTDIESARVATEAERLRSALLSSLSHDLRTPLASILGAATSLHNYDKTLKPDERVELLQTIQEEAERLNRFVQNLLDMTRIGAGALKPRSDWVDLSDIVGAARQRARTMLRHRRVRVDLESGLPLLNLDAILMEQVFFNLLDNACKYSPVGTSIIIRARRAGDRVVVVVEDQGPGIAPADRERVFDMFYRIEARDSQTAGTGLGLAICRGIVEAHGGTISAETGASGKGAAIVVSLPASDIPELPEPVPVRDSLPEPS